MDANAAAARRTDPACLLHKPVGLALVVRRRVSNLSKKPFDADFGQTMLLARSTPLDQVERA